MADARSILDAQITEREFQAQVIEHAQHRGWWVYHTYDSRRSQAGWPDLALVRGDRMVLAELKRQKGRATKPQEAVGAMLEVVAAASNGALVYRLWRPESWDEIEEMLA